MIPEQICKLFFKNEDTEDLTNFHKVNEPFRLLCKKLSESKNLEKEFYNIAALNRYSHINPNNDYAVKWYNLLVKVQKEEQFNSEFLSYIKSEENT